MDTDSPRDTDTARPFYGWRIIFLACCLDFVAVGFFFYSFGVFFNELVDEFQASRAQVSLAILVLMSSSAVFSPFVGKALDRLPLKTMIATGVVLMSAGLFGISLVAHLWQFFLLLGTLVGLGAATMGNMATAKMVTNWFTGKRGFALGLASMGVSASGIAMPVVTAWLVKHQGWRSVFQMYAAVLILVVLPVVLRFVVGRPADVGQRAYGATTDGSGTRIGPTLSTSLLRDQRFWGIGLAFGLMYCSVSAILTHLVPAVIDLGVDATQAAPLLSLSAAVAVVGKFFYGWFSDRAGPHRAMGASVLVQVAGLFFLAQADSYQSVLLAAALFGLGMGGMVPMQATLISETFADDRFATAMGLMRPVKVPFSAIGVPLAGWIFDRTGSYRLAFHLFMGTSLFALVLLWALSGRHKGKASRRQAAIVDWDKY